MTMSNSRSDSISKLKIEIHGIIGGLLETLRYRELSLMNHVDTLVNLESSFRNDEDEDDDDSGGRGPWRLVGNWRELQGMIERFGRVVEVRKRNESFEVITQENAASIAGDKMKDDLMEMNIVYDDGDDEEVRDDNDNDINKGFVFQLNNTKNQNKFNNENHDDRGNTEQEYEKVNDDKTNEMIVKQPLEIPNFESYIFKFSPKLSEIKEETIEKLESDPPFQFNFNDNPPNPSTLTTTEPVAMDNECILKFSPDRKIALGQFQCTPKNEDVTETGEIKSYKFQLKNGESSSSSKNNVTKNENCDLRKPFMFTMDDDNSNNNIGLSIDQSPSDDHQNLSYRFQYELRLNEELITPINQTDSFSFKFKPTFTTQQEYSRDFNGNQFRSLNSEIRDCYNNSSNYLGILE